jgi:MFS family permease
MLSGANLGEINEIYYSGVSLPTVLCSTPHYTHPLPCIPLPPSIPPPPLFLSLFVSSLGGRLGWAAISDYMGRKKMFYMFTFSSVPLYLAMPSLINAVVEQGSSVPLYLFIGSTVACISFMGGTYAILPAYEADLFGSKNVGPTHGVMMAYSAVAALAGPNLLVQLRRMSEKTAFDDLLSKVDGDYITKNTASYFIEMTSFV